MSTGTMRTVLVPLDGSELSERALEPARQLAEAKRASLLLLQVVPPRDPADRVERAAELEAAEHYLGDVADRLRRQGAVVLVEACAGDPVEQIADQAELWHSDLIVMSTHGRGGLGRLVRGSVADAVVRCARTPVVLVPARCGIHPWIAGDTILVPVDGSGFAEAALARAAELARELAAPLTILQVLSWAPTPSRGLAPSPDELHALVADAKRYVDHLVRDVRCAGVEAHARIVCGAPARSILECADQEKAGVIVMATHGRSGLGRFTLGSVATDVLTHAHQPLMLVRPVTIEAREPVYANGKARGVQS